MKRLAMVIAPVVFGLGGQSRARLGVRLGVAAVVSTLVAACTSPGTASTSSATGSPSTSSAAFRNPHAPTVRVGRGPSDVAVDTVRHTAYVTNNNDNTVSLVDIARCSARDITGCKQTAPTAAVGMGPMGDVLDAQTGTVYVMNGGADTVSMIDTKTCNATTTSGCSHVPTVTVGKGPAFAGVDTAGQTVYVANSNDNTVSAIDAATCNARVTSGCGQISTVAVGTSPTGVAVDEVTNTVYVAGGPTSGVPGAVWMIDAATCKARSTAGCGRTPISAPASVGAGWVAIDSSTHTLYVTGGATGNDATTVGFVDVIDEATCNATHTIGCRQTPLAVTVGSGPIGVVVDPRTHSVFVVSQEDSTVSVIDGTVCNAAQASGCIELPPTVAVGFDPGTLALDSSTETVYVPNQGEGTVSVLDAASCTRTHPSGCRQPAPTTTVGLAPQGIAANNVTDTVYAGDRGNNALSVINGATCNAQNMSGCGRPWPTVATGVGPQAVAVDERTDTVYTANAGSNADGSGPTVSVINGASCNAQVTSGCSQAPATVTVGRAPTALAVNDATNTIYVANGNDSTVSVIDGTTCNGTNHLGCGLNPPTVRVGDLPWSIAVDQTTDTIYVANHGDNTVSVIDGTTCNASVTSGCSQTPPTVNVGHPVGVAVNPVTHSVYVVNGIDSTGSVIDGATCNATNHSGCGQPPRTMVTTGGGPGIAIDQATDTVFVTSEVGSYVAVFNGATCNALVASGCSERPATVPTGGYTEDIVVIQATSTVYTTDNVDGEVSFFGFARGVQFP